MEEDLLVLDAQLLSALEHPIYDRGSQLARNVQLVREQVAELRLVLVLDHIIVELAPVILEIPRLLLLEQQSLAAKVGTDTLFARLSRSARLGRRRVLGVLGRHCRALKS